MSYEELFTVLFSPTIQPLQVLFGITGALKCPYALSDMFKEKVGFQRLHFVLCHCKHLDVARFFFYLKPGKLLTKLPMTNEEMLVYI